MGMNLQVDLEGIVAMLDDFSGSAHKIAATSLYKGAGIVADALTASINNIKTEPFHYVKSGETPRLPSPQEKAALGQGQFGVAKFKGSGSEIETSIGVGKEGYTHIMGTGKKSEKSRYNEGRDKSVQEIAFAINSGTSFMKKQPFMRLAFNRTKNAAISAIGASIEQQLQEIADRH